MELTRDQVAEYLNYNLCDGWLYWAKDPNPRGPRKAGTRAGVANASGYILVGIFGQRLYAHRLIWLLTRGYWPGEIDHINGNPSDNHLCNLRECKHARNIAARHNDACGYEIHGTKYRARINVDGTRHELGSFDNPTEAITAYKAARYRLLGEFA